MRQVVLRSRQAVAVALGGAILFGGLAGCSTDRQQVPTAHTARASTSATPTATSTLDPSAQAALDSYETSWQVTDEAGRTGHYRLPDLSEYFSGHVLDVISQNLDAYEKNGIISKGAVVLHPYVVAEELRSRPPAVTIADCVDDRHDLLYYAATGQPIDDVPGGFHAVTTVMSDLNGQWKATTQVTDAGGTCKLK